MEHKVHVMYFCGNPPYFSFFNVAKSITNLMTASNSSCSRTKR
ncbi:hypothetical protein C4K39_2379 [Pseudomonas sessilinigenes]|nr:hypothetical protein C4K39_2379 [Pseudomonas sessilinigenes]